MDNTTKALVIGGAAVVGLIVLAPKFVTATAGNVGSAAGESAGNAVSGAAIGAVKGVFVNPYQWSLNYKGYIPIVDDIAKSVAGIKNIGNPNNWFS